MKIVKTVKQWRRIRQEGPARGRSLGFVPTMGALHQGHMSLVERSRRENDLTLVSIFINPTQFNDPGDLRRYPRAFARDARELAAAGADYLFCPDCRELYPDGYRYRILENRESRLLCGASRPGHFEGVLTVVMKLLQIAQADNAYFGEKDFQQYRLIRGLARAFFLATKIKPCPIVREDDGLAMSSRNALLAPAHRRLAPHFSRLLKSGRALPQIARELRRLGFAVDYLRDLWGRRFGAVKLGKVRLIDNVEK